MNSSPHEKNITIPYIKTPNSPIGLSPGKFQNVNQKIKID
jgi:hypothetical protein